MHGLAEFSLWYPAAGFRFALIFIFGWRFGLLAVVPEVIAQGLMGQWDRLYRDFWNALIGIGGPTVIYTCLLLGLDRLRLLSDYLTNLTNIMWFTIAAIIAPLLAAPLMTWNAVYNDRMELSEFLDAALSFWVGDLVGILMVAPIILLTVPVILYRSIGMFSDIKLKTFWGEFVAAILFSWLVMDVVGATELRLKWIPLFLPFIIIGYRHGFAGTALLSLLLNILAVHPGHVMDLTNKLELQGFMAAGSALGLILGGLASARLHSERQLTDSFHTITQLDRTKTAGDMAAQLIHELTQPLGTTSIYTMGALQLHDQGKLTEQELVEVLGKIQLQNARTMEQVNRHRAFLKSGQTHKEDTSLQAIVDAIRPMIDISTAHANVNIDYYMPHEPLTIHADSIQLQQAILNLVKNSIEAMVGLDDKKIKIQAGRANNNRLYLSVTDTGPGFPSDYEPGTTTKPTGMGLGLKIVHQIVDAHDGELKLKVNNSTIYLNKE